MVRVTAFPPKSSLFSVFFPIDLTYGANVAAVAESGSLHYGGLTNGNGLH
jgi:hypothetical protein